jgi:hypothetical protein
MRLGSLSQHSVRSEVDSADSPRGVRNKAGQELVVSATGESHEEARADRKRVVLERHAGICGRLARRCFTSLPNQLLPRCRMLASRLRPPRSRLCFCFARRYTAPRLPRSAAPMRGVAQSTFGRACVSPAVGSSCWCRSLDTTRGEGSSCRLRGRQRSPIPGPAVALCGRL